MVNFNGSKTFVALSFFVLMIPCCLWAKGQPLQGKLVITGSSTVAPLVSEIAKRFEKKNSGTRIDVQTGGSSRGINDVLKGVASIGMVSRSLKVQEIKKLTGHPIAKDGICMILNSKNKLSSLSNQQIVDIYQGKIKNWKQVGGLERPIVVVNKAAGRSTLELFLKYFGLKNRDIKASVIIGDNEQGIKTVAGNPDAIGYVSIGAAEYSASHQVPIRLVPIDGVNASIEAVRSGSFPLVRDLNLVTKGEESELEKAFIKFAQSDEVHDLVKKQYFVPLYQ